MYRKLFVRVYELAALVVFTFYHICRIYMMPNQLNSHHFMYSIWLPLFTMFVFMVLPGNAGLLYSAAVLLITISFGLPHFTDGSIQVEALIELYLSSLVYMVILYFYQRLVSVYSEAELLRRVAYQDTLTGIGNRRMIDSWIESAMNEARKKGTTFSIIYFDIDHFKTINDRFGHYVGDRLLREFSSVVKANVGMNHRFGRWGGEEFIIVAMNDSTDTTHHWRSNFGK